MPFDGVLDYAGKRRATLGQLCGPECSSKKSQAPICTAWRGGARPDAGLGKTFGPGLVVTQIS